MESNLNKIKVKRRASLTLMFQGRKGVVDVLDHMHSKIVNGLPMHALHVGRLTVG